MKKFVLVLSLACGFGFANADEVQPYDGSGVYINANTGIGTFSGLPTGEWTGNINAGYNFNRAFALEGGYNIFTGSQFGASVSTNIIDFAAKGTIPLTDEFNLYGRAGLGWGLNSFGGAVSAANCVICYPANNGNFMLGLAGIGGSFTLDKHFDLRLEDTFYVPVTNSYTGNFNAVTAGVQYNF